MCFFSSTALYIVHFVQHDDINMEYNFNTPPWACEALCRKLKIRYGVGFDEHELVCHLELGETIAYCLLPIAYCRIAYWYWMEFVLPLQQINLSAIWKPSHVGKLPIALLVRSISSLRLGL